jgi:hypothetical protein
LLNIHPEDGGYSILRKTRFIFNYRTQKAFLFKKPNISILFYRQEIKLRYEGSTLAQEADID